MNYYIKKKADDSKEQKRSDVDMCIEEKVERSRNQPNI